MRGSQGHPAHAGSPYPSADHVKRTVDLAEVIRSVGIALHPHGRNDLVGLCPFHDDTEPSLVVTPSKGLFHCLRRLAKLT